MIQITLIRHAKVLVDDRIKCSASQISAWIESYDHVPIDTTRPSDEIVAHIKSADMVLASALSCTTCSLTVVGVSPVEKNTLFNEAEIPQVKGVLWKFRPKTWLVILRLMMLLGIGSKSQGFKASKSRAKEAAGYLVELSKKYGHIVLVGHGGMNWLISKELERSGYQLREKHGGSDNWGVWSMDTFCTIKLGCTGIRLSYTFPPRIFSVLIFYFSSKFE